MTLGTGTNDLSPNRKRALPKLWLFAFAAIAALAFAACSADEPSGNAGDNTEDDDSAIEAETTTDSDGGSDDAEDDGDADAGPSPSPFHPEDDGIEITVTQVIDGDTVEATSTEGDLTIRLLGINAPERDECYGPQAGDTLERILDRSTTTTLHPWPGETDEFGRQLGFIVSGEVFVNLRLLALGASVAPSQSDHEFTAEFETAENGASDEGVGLWASDACGTPVSTDLAIVDTEPNAPGDDRENPNGEWVLIGNLGGEPVQLEGWMVRDESTRHRFTFPELSLEPGQELRLRSGCDRNRLNAEPIEFHWCDPEPPIWNNGGDTAFLLDPNGSIVSAVEIGDE